MTGDVTEPHNGSVIEEIRRRLAAYAARELEGDGRPRAGVLVPVFLHRGELHVVLTRRTDHVANHRGEVSFPGGMMETRDADIVATALRESEEEIGLRREHVRVIGRLDELVTVSNFHVSAFVGEIDAAALPYVWRPQASEVARVLEVPLSHALDGENLVELPRQRDGRLTLMEGLRFGEDVVWGATWRMLRNFLEVAVGGLPDGDLALREPRGERQS